MKQAIIALALAVVLWGCAKQEQESNRRFEQVGSIGPYTYVYVDNETGVAYTVSHGGRTYGIVTPLVDADGKPLLWGE